MNVHASGEKYFGRIKTLLSYFRNTRTVTWLIMYVDLCFEISVFLSGKNCVSKREKKGRFAKRCSR